MINLKQQLSEEKTVIGPVLTIGAPEVAEMLSLAGFDFLWIDTEHAPTDYALAQQMIQAVGDRCPCLVRIPEAQEIWVKKALDIGSDGLIVPQVRNAVQVEQVIEWSLYPPQGRRSVGLARAHRYGMAFDEYLNTINRRLLIVIQIEHADAVANVEQIARVPGVGVLFIGPLDLSASLGHLGDADHPEVQAAIRHVREACAAAHVPAGLFCVDADSARAAIEQGFRFIALGTDSGFLLQAAQALLRATRATRATRA